MPWPPRQQRAIAASLARKGMSRAQIGAFFRKHGYGPERSLMKASGKGKR
jgi:hypothetical protein